MAIIDTIVHVKERVLAIDVDEWEGRPEHHIRELRECLLLTLEILWECERRRIQADQEELDQAARQAFLSAAGKRGSPISLTRDGEHRE